MNKNMVERCSDATKHYQDSVADPGFFLGGGALVSCSTSTPINHIVFFFCRIAVVLENRRSSQGGGGVHPLHPPPRSAPETCTVLHMCYNRTCVKCKTTMFQFSVFIF